jgi:hypothetical protein
VASWADVRAVALALPEVTENETAQGTARWRVRDKLFAWERPLRRADLEALGAAAPGGPVLAAHVADVGVRAVMISEEPDLYFTTPHFANYPAVLARLDLLGSADLEELLTEAWLLRAPARLRKAFEADAQG